jgi:hypothetical protein
MRISEGEDDYQKLHSLFNADGELQRDSDGEIGKGAGRSEERQNYENREI